MSSAKRLPTARKTEDASGRQQISIDDLIREQMKRGLDRQEYNPDNKVTVRLFRSSDWERIDPVVAESEQEEAFIKRVIENGPERKLHLCRVEVLDELNALLTKFPNFREVTTEIIGRYKISLLGGAPLSLPVINLQGPPGTGKTTYVRAVAAALGQPFHDLKISQMMDKFELAGMSKGWRGARPGKIAKILLEEEPKEGQPVILFDELCMAKDTEDHSVIHPLYTLFDRDSAGHFRDLFVDLPMDTSFVLAFCTTNNLEALRPALRSRLSSFHIEAPSREEMRLLAQKMYRQLLERFNVRAHFADLLSNAILVRLTEGSIRDMKLNLERAVIRAVGESNGQGRFRLRPEHVPSVQDRKRQIGFI